MADDQYVTISDLKRELERENKALVFALNQRFDQIDRRLDGVDRRLDKIETDLKLVKAATWDRLEEERNLAGVRGGER